MSDLVSETNHINNNEEVIIKKTRGRPKKEKPPQEPTEPQKQRQTINKHTA